MSCILRQSERERERERQTDREHIICVCVRAMYIARRSSRLVIIPDFPEFLPTGGKMPRGSQGAHAGALGGKMWVILRRIQQAHFRRNRRAGSRATSVAVRHRRRVLAHMHFSAVFHTKTGPIARLRVVWLQNHGGGTRCACFRACARVFRGGSPGGFLRERDFWRFVLQLFRQTVLEFVPTLQGS